MAKKPLREPQNVLYRIQRGLSGYVSYLAACEMNSAFTEYMLYEPILRVLTARGYAAQSEAIAPGVRREPRGDPPRIDFVARKKRHRFALEVKWPKSNRVDVRRDHQKLVAYRDNIVGAKAFLCVFGRRSHIERIQLNPNTFVETRSPVWADLKLTRFGCRIFEPSPNSALQPTSRASRKSKLKGRSRAARG